RLGLAPDAAAGALRQPHPGAHDRRRPRLHHRQPGRDGSPAQEVRRALGVRGRPRARVLSSRRAAEARDHAGAASGLRPGRRADLRGGDPITRTLQLLAGFGVSALAIFFLLRSVSLADLGAVLSHGQPGPMLLVVVATIVALAARAARWGAYFLPARR